MIGQWLRKRLGGVDELDPERVARVRRQFDEEAGYRDYHERCVALSTPLPDADPGQVATRGFEHLPAMSAAAAGSLLKELLERFGVESVKKDKAELQGFQIVDDDFRDRALEAALGGAVHDRAEGFFGSHYRVHWYFVTATDAGEGTDSFSWHCDKGPSQHLKLLAYLNDETEHGGNTELLDLEASEKLAELGYPFGPARRRSDDLSSLADRVGIPYQPVRRHLSAGEGILFQPSRVLHRGISPSRGSRYVLTLCLLPSPVPWREALRDGGMFDLRTDAKWHRDARTLL